jgi:hypothetical protein
MATHGDVEEVLLRYAIAVDTRDLDLLATCYGDAATVDVSHRGVVARGREAIIAGTTKLLEAVDATYHVITNPRTTVSGDSASMTAYAQTWYFKRGAPDGESLIVFGIYEIELVRVDGSWSMRDVALHEIWSSGNQALGGRSTPGYEPAWRRLRRPQPEAAASGGAEA